MSGFLTQEGKKDMKKSAVRGYASELLLLTIRTTDNVGFLEKYAGELIALGKHDEHSKLAELASWSSVLQEEQHFRHEGIPSLCEVVKKNMENVSPMSYELVTSVKLLKHLAVQPKFTRCWSKACRRLQLSAQGIGASTWCPLGEQLKWWHHQDWRDARIGPARCASREMERQCNELSAAHYGLPERMLQSVQKTCEK